MRSAKRKIKITVLLERGGYFTFMDTIAIKITTDIITLSNVFPISFTSILKSNDFI